MSVLACSLPNSICLASYLTISYTASESNLQTLMLIALDTLQSQANLIIIQNNLREAIHSVPKTIIWLISNKLISKGYQ
ncbi:unnamed protein product [Heterobilharzia americana]|nr:unnamed protein product [Heterobilharzia americana]